MINISRICELVEATEQLLLENRVEWLRKNLVATQAEYEKLSDPSDPFWKRKLSELFKTKVAESEFSRLLEADPSKNKQYVQWLMKQLLKLDFWDETRKRFVREDLEKIQADLKVFDKIKQRLPADQRDINRLTPEQLFEIVEPYRAEEELQSNREQEKQIKAQTIRLLDTEQYLVLIPKTKEAAQYYGKGTRWCTAGENYNYFDQYNRQGPLFIVIVKSKPGQTFDEFAREQFIAANKESPQAYEIWLEKYRKYLMNSYNAERGGEKYQIHFESGQVMNAQDHGVSLVELGKKHPAVQDAIANWLIGRYQERLKGEDDTGAEAEYENSWRYPDSKELIQRLAKLGAVRKAVGVVPDKALATSSDVRVLVSLVAEGVLKPEAANAGLGSGTVHGKPGTRPEISFVSDKLLDLVADDWGDFEDWWGKDREGDYAKMAEDVFGGDIWSWFDGGELPDIESCLNYYLSDADLAKVEAKARELKYSFKDFDEEGEDQKLEWLLKNRDDWEPITDAIRFACDSAQRSADESEVYNDFVKALEEVVGKHRWEQSALKFRMSIKEFQDLMTANLPDEEDTVSAFGLISELGLGYVQQSDGIKVNMPHYGWGGQGTIDKPYLTECLENQLAEIE